MNLPLIGAIFLCVVIAPLGLAWWFSMHRHPPWTLAAAVFGYPFFCVIAIGLAVGATLQTYALWCFLLALAAAAGALRQYAYGIISDRLFPRK